MTEEVKDPFIKRLLVGSLAFLVFVGATYLTQSPTFSWLFLVVLMGVVAIAQWEFYRLVIHKAFEPATWIGIGSSILYLAALWITVNGPVNRLPELVLVVCLTAASLRYFCHRPNTITNLALTFFGVAYLAIPLGFVIDIVYHPFNEAGQDGRWWLLYAILVTKMTDIGGYAIGRTMGHTPLCPSISPKKTVEGAVGGLAFSVIASILLGSFYLHLSLFQSIGLGVLINLAAQIGDLAESLLKRDAAVKDSNTLPGLGGILDMVDSVIFTVPLVYFFMQFG